jgi:p-cumate 2,3-dioxygenase alpha subunit
MNASAGFKDLVVEVKGSDFRVHRSVFVDEDVLRRERQTIFARSWMYMGHASEVPNPGDFVTRNLLGEALILSRDRHGEVRVFFNSCRHRGALVCREPSGNAKHFRCPYHLWTYRDTGELTGVADKASFPPSFDQKANGLVSPRVEIYRDFVFITFNGDAPGLDEHLAPVRPYLDAVIDQSVEGRMEVVEGSHLYRMGGNWKLVVENSLDGYHGMAVHQTYFKYLGDNGYDLSGGLDGIGLGLGNGHAVLRYLAPFGRSVARSAPVMSTETQGKIGAIEADLINKHGANDAELIAHVSKNILIYPNLLIIDAASLQLRVLDPISPDTTDISAWCLAPVGEDDDLRDHRLRGYLEFLGPGGLATPDDNEVIETCQIGYGQLHGAEWSFISKGMGKETPSVTDEEQVRAFWRQWQHDIDQLDDARSKPKAAQR